MKNKLHTKELYLPTDPDILQEQERCLELQYDYNNTRPSEGTKRAELLSKMFAEIGEGCYIEPPLHANWGGHHVHFGKNVYANFNLTMVDDTHIYVGDNTLFGPNVVLATGGHPLLPELRAKGYQFNAPIHIGKNCWLGAGVMVMPGITIGDNTVVGAGSIVTKNLPSGVLAVGNPCRVLRMIGEHERKFYFKDKKENPCGTFDEIIQARMLKLQILSACSHSLILFLRITFQYSSYCRQVCSAKQIQMVQQMI